MILLDRFAISAYSPALYPQDTVTAAKFRRKSRLPVIVRGAVRAVMKSLSHNADIEATICCIYRAMRGGCARCNADTHACVSRAQIGNRRARALSRKPTLKQTNLRERERKRERKREKRNERRANFAKSRARARACTARDEKFSISRTIIVALAAFAAGARFQSRRRPVECILFTIPRRGVGCGEGTGGTRAGRG